MSSYMKMRFVNCTQGLSHQHVKIMKNDSIAALVNTYRNATMTTLKRMINDSMKAEKMIGIIQPKKNSVHSEKLKT